MSRNDDSAASDSEEELILSPSESVAHNSAMRISGGSGGQRSTRKALASIVLGFELIIVVLIGLTIFGLGLTDPRWLGLVIGGTLAVLCIISLGLLRVGEVGIVLGWITHALMLATAFILPTALFVGAVFTALWVYCIVRGGKIDRQRDTWLASLN
ncbi:DUF4233 domain-containing protein [Leucobacter denitrificans]|uniref:DUF4233 domain-containing protein n=1 Tax=Leucobacter denitrificans TaxID=683042 RepID=A0A7G9S5S2_9MICO|nr:DUF4233 domain-containing protein [Leucobacter denitrificans]QNN63197.1 DUF4233 domain-containing protein [Leucobacter denitrificans]